MAENKLEIIIDSNVAGAMKGVQETVTALREIPPATAKVSQAVDKAAKSTNNLTKATGGATNVLSNFGRVAQDAAFGPAAIANNLNPLVESFQRLKKESGSTGGALKALAGDLIGGGGVGFAISAITAALSFASVGLAMWGKKSKEAGDEAKKAAEGVKDFSDAVASEIVKANALGQVIGDTTQPYRERVLALQELRKQYPDYLQGLTDEEALTKGVSIAIRALTIDLIRRGVVLAQQEKINKIIGESLNNITKDVKEQGEKLAAGRKNIDAAFNNKKVDEFDASASKVTTTLGAISDKGLVPLTKGQIQANLIFSKLQEILGPLINDLGDFGGTLTSITEKTDKTHKKFEQVIEDIGKFEALGRGFTALGGFTDFILNARIQFRKDAFNDLKKDAQDLVNLVNKGPDAPKLPLRMDVNISDAIKKVEDAGKALQARVANFRSQLFESIQGMAVDTVAGLAEGIGNALSGVKNPFGAILEILGSGLQSLGKMVIKTFITLEALKKLLEKVGIANPAVGIAIGAAMVALGTVIKNQVKSTKFAEGGIVSGPTNALIGEAGQSEVVLPLSRLSGMLSNNRGALVLETRVSGQDLLLVQARAAASQGRTFR